MSTLGSGGAVHSAPARTYFRWRVQGQSRGDGKKRRLWPHLLPCPWLETRIHAPAPGPPETAFRKPECPLLKDAQRTSTRDNYSKRQRWGLLPPEEPQCGHSERVSKVVNQLLAGECFKIWLATLFLQSEHRMENHSQANVKPPSPTKDKLSVTSSGIKAEEIARWLIRHINSTKRQRSANASNRNVTAFHRWAVLPIHDSVVKRRAIIRILINQSRDSLRPHQLPILW